MPKKSAGLLMFRFGGGRPEVLLVHPGGPYWRKKDKGKDPGRRSRSGPGLRDPESVTLPLD